MRKKIHQQIYWYSCLGIAFMLPVWGKLIPTIIVIFILNWLLSGDYLKTVPVLFSVKSRRNTLLFSCIYLLYVIGLLYTTDFTYAWFDLEVKLSLLIFPLIFSTADVGFLDSKWLRLMMLVYIAGCILGSFLLLGHGYTLWEQDIPGAFYYMKLSWYFHPSYFAMYVDFAMAFIVLELLKKFSSISPVTRIIYYLLLAYFFVFIFLLSSKMGLVCMVIIAVLTSAELVFRKRKMVPGLALIIMFLLIAWGGLHFFKGTSIRVSRSSATLTGTVADTVKSKSTSDRVDIWKIAVQIIKSNPWIGVGTGDVKDQLIEQYKEKNIEHALEFRLNAHNQYLQTFVTLGLPGIAALLLMLILPMAAAFRRGYYLYFVFILLFSVNIFVESMLEEQAGVVWYAFFNIILFTVNRES